MFASASVFSLQELSQKISRSIDYSRTSLIWTSKIRAPLLSGQHNEEKKNELKV